METVLAKAEVHMFNFFQETEFLYILYLCRVDYPVCLIRPGIVELHSMKEVL